MLAAAASGWLAAEDPGPREDQVGAQEDNHYFFPSRTATDDLYTQGLRLYGKEWEPLPDAAHRDELQYLTTALGTTWWSQDKTTTTYAHGLALGQEIYTPASILHNQNFGPGQQPYAGWLYGALTSEIAGPEFHDLLEIDLGVVGPASESAATQTYFHRVTHNSRPDGWSNQLHGEPGLDLIWRHDEWLPLTVALPDGAVVTDSRFDAIGTLGNIHTQLEAGLQWRGGWNLSHAGGPNGEPALGTATKGWRRFEVGVVLSGAGTGVLRNIFLDGNTFRESAHVTKRPLIWECNFGAVVGCAITHTSRIDLACIEVIDSKEFYGADHNDRYGSLIASFAWAY